MITMVVIEVGKLNLKKRFIWLNYGETKTVKVHNNIIDLEW